MAPASPLAKAYGIALNLWIAADKYVQTCGFSRNLSFLLHVWCGFYYCISDIVRKNGLESLVFDQFPEITRRFFSISRQEDDLIRYLCDEQDFILSKLSAEEIDPLSQDGILDVQKTVFLLASLHSKDHIYLADSVQELQFVASLNQLTHSICSLLSDMPESKNSPSSSLRPSPVFHSKSFVSAKHNSSSKGTSKIPAFSVFKIIASILVVLFLVTVFCICVYENYQQSLSYYDNSVYVSESASTYDNSTATSAPGILNDKHTYNDVQNQYSGRSTEPKLAAQPRPYNGKIIIHSQKNAVAPLSVFTSYGEDYYLCLTDVKTNEIEMSFFVRGGTDAYVEVPLGTYEIFYATGTTWYGKEHLFGRETRYYKCDEDFTFSKTSTSYTGWDLTLYAVTNGNMDSDPISADTFPK